MLLMLIPVATMHSSAAYYCCTAVEHEVYGRRIDWQKQ